MYESLTATIERLEKLGVSIVKRDPLEVRIQGSGATLALPPNERSHFLEITQLVKGYRTAPFRFQFILSPAGGGSLTLLIPDSRLAESGPEFVDKISLGHSFVQGRKIVTKREADSQKGFSRPGMEVNTWELDSAGQLWRPLLPLHQLMQPRHLFAELPPYVVGVGGLCADMFYGGSTYVFGSVLDKIKGVWYDLTTKTREDIFMSGDQAYRDQDISDYFANKYSSLQQ